MGAVMNEFHGATYPVFDQTCQRSSDTNYAKEVKRTKQPYQTGTQVMAKYYVQSGTMRTVVQAESSRKAAIWAVHEAMQQVLPMGDDSPESPAAKSERIRSDRVAVLSGKVTISQRGFSSEAATTIPTLEVVSEWNQMVTTLDRLERMLYRAA
jgi:hypothetical protein